MTFEEANEGYRKAWHNFELADRDHVDAAIYELNAAQEKLMNAIRNGRKDKYV